METDLGALYDEEHDEIVEMPPQPSLSESLFSAAANLRDRLFGAPDELTAEQEMARLANEQYNEMVAKVRRHFRRAIIAFPLSLDYPVLAVSEKGTAIGAISLYDILPDSIQPDDPLDQRMAKLHEVSSLLWLLDTVVPVTRWAVRMITDVPRRLAQVLVVDIGLIKEAASRTAFKALADYRTSKAANGKQSDEPMVDATSNETQSRRDITSLINSGLVDDEWTAQLAARYTGPKRLFRNLYTGGYWTDTPSARRGLALAKVLNDLQFGKSGYSYQTNEGATVSLDTVDHLLDLFKNLGFSPRTYLNIRIADLLDLHSITGLSDPQPPTRPAELEITNVISPLLLLVPSPTESDPYVVPAMHSEWHIVFVHPPKELELGFRFFHDMASGAVFHPRDAWKLPNWIQDRHSLQREGWEDTMKIVEWSRRYITALTALDLGPNDGYGLVGVCQDSVGPNLSFIPGRN